MDIYRLDSDIQQVKNILLQTYKIFNHIKIKFQQQIEQEKQLKEKGNKVKEYKKEEEEEEEEEGSIKDEKGEKEEVKEEEAKEEEAKEEAKEEEEEAKEEEQNMVQVHDYYQHKLNIRDLILLQIEYISILIDNKQYEEAEQYIKQSIHLTQHIIHDYQLTIPLQFQLVLIYINQGYDVHYILTAFKQMNQMITTHVFLEYLMNYMEYLISYSLYNDTLTTLYQKIKQYMDEIIAQYNVSTSFNLYFPCYNLLQRFYYISAKLQQHNKQLAIQYNQLALYFNTIAYHTSLYYQHVIIMQHNSLHMIQDDYHRLLQLHYQYGHNYRFINQIIHQLLYHSTIQFDSKGESQGQGQDVKSR